MSRGRSTPGSRAARGRRARIAAWGLLCAPLLALAGADPGPSQSEQQQAPDPAARGRASAKRLGLDLGSSDAPLKINAARQTLRERSEGGRLSVWSGDVALDQGELSLRCDQLEIYFSKDEAGGSVEKIQAQGKVQIRQRDIEMRCDRAIYEADGCRAVCERTDACGPSGALAEPALLRQGKDTVRGGRIEFDVCTGDFQVTCGASGSFQPRQRQPERPKAGPAGAKTGPATQPQPGQSAPAAGPASTPGAGGSALQPGRDKQK